MGIINKINLNGVEYDIDSVKAVQDESGNNIKNSYASSLNINNGNVILQNKNGDALSTVALPTASVVSTTTDGLAPQITNTDGYLKGDGTWSVPPGASYDVTKGTVGSATAGTAINTSVISTWDAGSSTAVNVQNGVLNITTGTAPSLTYSAVSVPNISVTSTSVVTDVVES